MVEIVVIVVIGIALLVVAVLFFVYKMRKRDKADSGLVQIKKPDFEQIAFGVDAIVPLTEPIDSKKRAVMTQLEKVCTYCSLNGI